MIEYISYESVNGVPFGATEEEVIKVFGEPDSRDLRSNGTVILNYMYYGINFNKKDQLIYFGVSPKPRIIIDGEPAGWTLKEVANIISMDNHPVVDDAYIILRDLGVTFINFHDIEDDDTSERVMAFFAKGEMEVYDTEKPFRLKDKSNNPNNEIEIIDEPEEQ